MINNFLLIFRSLLFWSNLIISVLLFGPITFLIGLLSYNTCLKLSKTWCWYNIYFLKYVCSLDFKLQNQNLNESNIIICKHQSAWETIYLTAVVDKPIFILKKELLLIPLFGWCLYLLKNVAIDRAKGSKSISKILHHCKKEFIDDKTLIIFPEGTRVPYGETSEIKKGVILILKSLKKNALMVNHNSGLFWSKSSYIIKPGVINITTKNLEFTDNPNYLHKEITDFLNS